MSWLMWLILWAVVSLLPIGTIIGKLFSKNEEANSELLAYKFIISIFVGVMLILTNLASAYMWWVIIFFGLLWIAIELIAMETSSVVKDVSAIILVIFTISWIYVGATAGVNNARYFDQFITKTEEFPIKNEIADDSLRLTTEELAKSIAKQHMSEFGSNVVIADVQLTTSPYNIRPAWVAQIAKEGSWGQYYEIEGLIIVDQNNPDASPKIVKEKFAIADGLSFNPLFGAYGNAGAKGYYGISTDLVYGDVYPAFDGKKWHTIMTTYEPNLRGVRQFSGIQTLDQNGNLGEKYDKNIPSWMAQPFPESGFLEEGVSDWGYYRRGEMFDFWSGGILWIAPSNDRVEMSEDTRYIYDPDSGRIVSMIMVHPTRDRGEFSLAGIFRTTPDGITYHDLRKFDMISGIAAGSVVKSKITQRAGTIYYTSMELLYPMNISGTIKYVYFVPVYYRTESTGLIGLAGLGIVDAQEQNTLAIEFTEKGVTGAELVKKTKESFRNLYTGKGKKNETIEREKNNTTNLVVIIRDNQGKETKVPLPLNSTISIVSIVQQ